MDYEKKYKEALERVRRLHDRMLVLSSTDALVASAELEFIFPELAESEDERIRKELKEAFEAYDIESTWNGIPIRSIITWLEKQKEQNGEDEFLEDELSAFLQNYDKEYDDDAAVADVARHFYEIGKKQKEQKPHTDEEKEYVRTIKSIMSDFIRDKKPENLAYYQRIYDWLDGRHVPFSCGHENGQPTEWSEEDEKRIQRICGFLWKNRKGDTDTIYQIEKDADWLKSLPERFNPQPKQEWSEEDENALKYIHELLVFGYTEKFMDAQTAHDMRKWVNEHLRPDTFQNGNSHWKPSEEQPSTSMTEDGNHTGSRSKEKN